MTRDLATAAREVLKLIDIDHPVHLAPDFRAAVRALREALAHHETHRSREGRLCGYQWESGLGPAICDQWRGHAGGHTDSSGGHAPDSHHASQHEADAALVAAGNAMRAAIAGTFGEGGEVVRAWDAALAAAPARREKT